MPDSSAQQHTPPYTPAPWLIYALLIFLAILSAAPPLLKILELMPQPYFFVDATCFSCAVKHGLLQGLDPYDALLQKECAAAAGVYPTPFFYPPWTLVVLGFLGPFSVSHAGWLMLALNVHGIAVSYLLLARTFFPSISIRKEQGGLILAITSLAWLGLNHIAVYNISQGQVNLLGIGLLSAFIATASLQRDRAAGVFLGLAILFKIHFIFLLLLPLLMCRWRMLQVSLFVLVIAALLVQAINPSLWAIWIGFLPSYSRPDMSGLMPETLIKGQNLALSGFFWRVLGDVDSAAMWSRIASLVLLLPVIWQLLRLKCAPQLFWTHGVAIMLCWLFLASPLSWVSHYAFLLPVFFALVSLISRQTIWPLLAIGILICSFDLFEVLGPLRQYLPTLSVAFAGMVLVAVSSGKYGQSKGTVI